MNVYLPYTARLPSAYQEVEYIRTSGTQYINTGIQTNGKDDTEIEAGLRYYQNMNSYTANGRNNRYWLFFGLSNNNKFYGGAGGYWGVTNINNDFQKHIFKVSTNETNLYVDGTSYNIGININSEDKGYGYIAIGCVYSATNNIFENFCTEDIYSFKISQGGTLVRDFVPCYRKSDGVIGMYDLVNSVFYTNSGTGTFSKGNDVTMTELKNAYIGECEPFIPGSNTIAYFPFTNNALDQLGNYTLSNSGTKQSIGYLFNTPSSVSGVSDYSQQKFASYWVKFQASNNATVLIGCGGLRLNNRAVSAPSYSEFVFKDSGGSFHNLGNNGINNSTWYHVAYGWEGNTYRTYVNGVLKNSGSATPVQYSECWIVGGTNGVILSELIYEKSMRTAQEISNYYNQTKSNYGL